MPRLFTGIEIPRDIGERLALLRGGLPGARWIDPENYHLTLRFIGDIDMDVANEVAGALGRVRRAEFALAPRRPRLARHAQAAHGRGADRRRRRRSPSCRPSTSASCSGSGCRPSSGNTPRM